VLRHRVVLSPAAEIDGRSTDAVLENIISSIEAPR
jgi:MoxR-like ATPase